MKYWREDRNLYSGDPNSRRSSEIKFKQRSFSFLKREILFTRVSHLFVQKELLLNRKMRIALFQNRGRS